MTSFRLDGRRALVTGAGRGIGQACAVALAEAGADVILLSRTREELDMVAERVASVGRHAEPVVCDVTRQADVASAVSGLGPIDILVNNAGTNIPEPFLEVTEDHLDTTLELNVKGPFLVSQVVARGMVERGKGGVIINMSSQTGHVGVRDRTAYCASKHAVEGLTKALAIELAPHGIRVNSIAPTYIETPLTRPYLSDPDFRAEARSRIPMGEIGDVNDVVGAVVYLASPAAALVTGASLLVDGGYTAQ